MSARAFRGLSGDPLGQRVRKVVDGGAGSNHCFRVVNHHVLDGHAVGAILAQNHIWRHLVAVATMEV